jgi:putative transposase
MAKRKFTEEQILSVVKHLEAGRTAVEMAREVGVSTFTIYSWKAKYGGMEPSEAARLHHLEDENNRLKRLVADLSLDREMRKALLIKNGLSS